MMKKDLAVLILWGMCESMKFQQAAEKPAALDLFEWSVAKTASCKKVGESADTTAWGEADEW
jgi:hypothetical protein